MKQKDKRIEKHLTDSVRLSLSEPAVCIGRTGRNISRYSRGTLFIVLVLTCLASNCRDNNPPPPAKVALMPMCTIELETGNNGPPSWGYNGQIFVADRDNATVQGNFSPFRLASGPLGDPTIDHKRSLVIRSTDLPDVFGFNEATLRRRGDYEVHRAQLIPIWINNYGYNEDDGVAWKIQVEDAFGKWTTQGAGVPSFGWDTMQKTLASQSPTKAPLGQEVWAGPTPENLGATPQLMSVGEADLHVFACAGSRTEDDSDWSTWLFESLSPKSGGEWIPIQDILNGDDHFVPDKFFPSVAPLAPDHTGPHTPPSPTMSGPGYPIRRGAVQCCMTQLGDDVTTRTLHMLALQGGQVLYANLSNFGTVTHGVDQPESRFRNVSPWGDVLSIWGGFGEPTSIAMAAQGNLLSIFFVEKRTDGRYKIFHIVRFPSGSWRAPVDVLSDSDQDPTGLAYPMQIAAGACPAFGAPPDSSFEAELVLAISNLSGISTITVTPTPRIWVPGWRSSDYSPRTVIDRGVLQSTDDIRRLHVATRPFSDKAMPPP